MQRRPRPYQQMPSATRSFPFTLAPFAITARSDGLDRPTRYCLPRSSVADFLTSGVTCMVRYPDNMSCQQPTGEPRGLLSFGHSVCPRTPISTEIFSVAETDVNVHAET